jgi:hypothetical protein
MKDDLFRKVNFLEKKIAELTKKKKKLCKKTLEEQNITFPENFIIWKMYPEDNIHEGIPAKKDFPKMFELYEKLFEPCHGKSEKCKNKSIHVLDFYKKQFEWVTNPENFDTPLYDENMTKLIEEVMKEIMQKNIKIFKL